MFFSNGLLFLETSSIVNKTVKSAYSDQPLLVKPGERFDNMFLQYKDKHKPLSPEEYDAPRLVPELETILKSSLLREFYFPKISKKKVFICNL